MNFTAIIRRIYFSLQVAGGRFVRVDLLVAATCILLVLLCSTSPGASAWTTTATTTRPRGGRIPRPPLWQMIAPQQLGSFETLDDDVLPVGPAAAGGQRRVRMLNWVRCSPEHGDEASTTTKRCVDFHDAWDAQKELLQSHLNRLQREQQQQQPPSSSSAFLSSPLSDDDNGDDDDDNLAVGKDTVIFLEHAPVYTLGTGSDEKFVKQQSPASSNDGDGDDDDDDDDNSNNIPVIRMDRGGEVTYHGPGQLTVYPVLDLRNYKQDIHWYVRALEEVVIVALRECGIAATREPGVTGVWVDRCKVAAVGVKCKRWITQHGVAVNVAPESLHNFGGIVPCGLEGRRVGCVQQFLADNETVTVQQMATYVQSALEDVFRIRLVQEE